MHRLPKNIKTANELDVPRKVTVVYTATTVSAPAMKAATSMIPVGSRPARTRSNRVWWPALNRPAISPA